MREIISSSPGIFCAVLSFCQRMSIELKSFLLFEIALLTMTGFLSAQTIASVEKGDLNGDGAKDSLWFSNSWQNEYDFIWEGKLFDGSNGTIHKIYAHDNNGKLITFFPLPKSLEGSKNKKFIDVILRQFAGGDYAVSPPAAMRWLLRAWMDGPQPVNAGIYQYGFQGDISWEYDPGGWKSASFKPAVISISGDSLRRLEDLIFPSSGMRESIPHSFDRGYLIYHGDYQTSEEFEFPSQVIVTGNPGLYRAAQGLCEIKEDSIRWLFVEDYIYYYSTPLKRAYAIGLTEWGPEFIALSFFRPRGLAYNLAVIEHATGKVLCLDPSRTNQGPPTFSFGKEELQIATDGMGDPVKYEDARKALENFR